MTYLMSTNVNNQRCLVKKFNEIELLKKRFLFIVYLEDKKTFHWESVLSVETASKYWKALKSKIPSDGCKRLVAWFVLTTSMLKKRVC